MNFFVELAESELIYRLGWALLHSLWLLALLGIVTMAALTILRRSSAQARYASSCIGLLLMAIAPLGLLAFSPAKNVEKPGTVGAAVAPFSEVGVPAGDRTGSPAISEPVGKAAPRSEGAVDPLSHPMATESPVAAESAGAGNASRSTWQAVAAPWMSLAWIIGVLVLSVWRTGGWWTAQRMQRIGSDSISGKLVNTIDQLRGQIGVSRPVRVLKSRLVQVPVVVGWLKPTILIPLQILESLTATQLRMVLAHELAHVRRRDYLANLLQTCVETLLFFHPAVWWVSRRIRTERENCCDDLAVKHCGRGADLAGALVAVEEGLGERLPEPALAVSGGDLDQRVRRLLGVSGRGRDRIGVSLFSLLFGLGLVALIGLAVAAPAPNGEQSADPERAEEGKWGPVTKGLQMRLRIANHDGADANINDVRIEIANRRATPVTLLVPPNDPKQSRDLSSYVRNHISFEAVPDSVPREYFQEVAPYGKFDSKRTTIKPGEVAVINWTETGSTLGRANGYLRFNRPGLFKIRAGLNLLLDGEEPRIELTSNHQDYIAGGSKEKPLRGTGKVRVVESEVMTARLDAGSDDGLRVGDQFEYFTIGMALRFTVAEVEKAFSHVEFAPIRGREEILHPGQGEIVVPIDIPRLQRSRPDVLRWGSIQRGLALGLHGLKPQLVKGQPLKFELVLRNFGKKPISVLPLKEELISSRHWAFQFKDLDTGKDYTTTGPAFDGNPSGTIELLQGKQTKGKVVLGDNWTYQHVDGRKFRHLPVGRYRMNVYYDESAHDTEHQFPRAIVRIPIEIVAADE